MDMSIPPLNIYILLESNPPEIGRSWTLARLVRRTAEPRNPTASRASGCCKRPRPGRDSGAAAQQPRALTA